MARIRSSGAGDVLRVSLTGRLTAADMRRLEHACAPALSDPAIELEIDLRRVTEVDPTARAVLHRMTLRGARLWPPADGSLATTRSEDTVRMFPRTARRR